MEFAKLFEMADAGWQRGFCGTREKPMDPVLASESFSRPEPRVAKQRRQPAIAQHLEGEVPLLEGRLVAPHAPPLLQKATPIPRIPMAAAVSSNLAVPPSPTSATLLSATAQEPTSGFSSWEGLSFDAVGPVDSSSESDDDLAYEREMAKCRDRLAEVLQQERTAIEEATEKSSKASTRQAQIVSLERTMSDISFDKVSPTLFPIQVGSSSSTSMLSVPDTVSAPHVRSLSPDRHEAAARTLQPDVYVTHGNLLLEPSYASPPPLGSEQKKLSNCRAPALRPPAGALQLPSCVLQALSSASPLENAETCGTGELCAAPPVEEQTPDVHELYERANVGERIRQLRRNRIAGGESAPEPGSHWSAGSPQVSGKEVEDYQMVMRQKLELLGAAEARSKALHPSPVTHSAAVRDALRHYHEHCQDIGELYAMPGEQRQRGLSAEEGEQLAALARDIK